MKKKPISPYQRLLDEIIKFCGHIKYRHKVFMWGYPKDKLDTGWSLRNLAERVQAGKQLGYDTILEVSDDGQLNVFYHKKIEIPFEWKA